MTLLQQRCQINPVTDQTEWTRYFNAVAQPHLMQSWSYGQAKKQAAGWQVQRYVFAQSGQAVAICQVLEKRIAGLRVAARVNRGPLFLEAAPTFATKFGVYRRLREQWRYLAGGLLLIAPALTGTDENRALLKSAGFKSRNVSGWRSARINLDVDARELHAKLTSTWRNRLKKSQRSGLVLHSSNSVETIQWMLDLHAKNMVAMKFKGPAPALVLALYHAQPDDLVVLSATLGGVPVAAMLIARFGACAEYYIGWFGNAEARRANAGNFIYWNAVLMMQQAGHKWLDLGGYYSNDHFGHFKQGMGGAEYQLIGEWWCA